MIINKIYNEIRGGIVDNKRKQEKIKKHIEGIEPEILTEA